MKQIRELRNEFIKQGDMFIQEGYNPNTQMYLYRRLIGGNPDIVYYEVFKKKIGHLYKSPEKCIRYPGNEDFGKWAKCCRNYDKAKEYFNKGI